MLMCRVLSSMCELAFIIYHLREFSNYFSRTITSYNVEFFKHFFILLKDNVARMTTNLTFFLDLQISCFVHI